MKTYLFIFLILSICTTCSTKETGKEIEYVYFFLMGYTDSVTNYNKGLAVASFLEYNFKTDSVVYRTPLGADSTGHKILTGRFKNKKYIDTIVSAVSFLKKHPEGEVPSLDTSNATYCGPVFYLKFKDKKGVHYYSFIIEDDGALWDFEHFFFRIANLSWIRKIEEKSTLLYDSLAIETYIKIGIYDDIEPPYIPVKCEPGIEMMKIYGTWRSIGNEYIRETENTYSKRVFTKDGIYEDERIKKDTSAFKFTAKFKVDQKRNTIILNKNGSLKELKILKLTDDCLEYKFEGINSVFTYNRLR